MSELMAHHPMSIKRPELVAFGVTGNDVDNYPSPKNYISCNDEGLLNW